MLKQYKVTVNGTVYDVTVEETSASAVTTPVSAPAAPAPAPASVAAPAPAPAAKPAAPVGNGEKVESPLNGTILKINVASGASVKSGDVLMVIEAMKMENEIMAPCDGTVSSVTVAQGATVAAGDVLLTIA